MFNSLLFSLGKNSPLPVQDEGVMELAERCAQLRYLCISNCPHLTDQSLAALANHCPHLVTLECAGLSQLTDAGFQVLLHRFDRLWPFNTNSKLFCTVSFICV
jgi:hypothetical protein